MPTLNFTVRDKVITRNPENEHYVNGNSDYLIHLDLDQEWSEFAVLTARLRWIEGSECLNRDILFTGTDFEFPVMYNVKYIEIGIFAGNKHTTTPAIIVCDGCILDGDPIEDDPDPDVYAQLLDLIQQGAVKGKSPYIGDDGYWYEWDTETDQYIRTNVEAKGDKGDKGDTGEQGIQGERGDKGDKGDKGDQGIQGIQGIQGETGNSGVYYGSTPPTDPEARVWVNEDGGDDYDRMIREWMATLTGYDAEKTQFLKKVNTAISWVEIPSPIGETY